MDKFLLQQQVLTFTPGEERRSNGEISKGLAKKVVVAKVDGAVWDLTRPLEGDCALQLLTWDDVDGKEVRWGRQGAGRGPVRAARAGCRAVRRGRAAPSAIQFT